MKSIGLTIVVAILSLNESPTSVCFNLVPAAITRSPTTRKNSFLGNGGLVRPTTRKNSVLTGGGSVPSTTGSHPCKADRRSKIFKLKKFETRANDGNRVLCRRLNQTELTKLISCSTTFKQKFAATSVEFALKNSANLIPKVTGAGRFPDRPVRQKPGRSRVKRAGNSMMPNTTSIFNCADRLSIDLNTGLGLPCGLCSTTYHQADSSRFPPFLNGLVCHPNETATVYGPTGTPLGQCVQTTLQQDFLEWTGEWEIDHDMTAQLGGSNVAYKEKWVFYRQTINSGCSFLFYTAS